MEEEASTKSLRGRQRLEIRRMVSRILLRILIFGEYIQAPRHDMSCTTDDSSITGQRRPMALFQVVTRLSLSDDPTFDDGF